MEETSGGQGAAVGRKIGASLPKKSSIVDQPQPSCAWSRLCQINTLLGLKASSPQQKRRCFVIPWKGI